MGVSLGPSEPPAAETSPTSKSRTGPRKRDGVFTRETKTRRRLSLFVVLIAIKSIVLFFLSLRCYGFLLRERRTLETASSHGVRQPTTGSPSTHSFLNLSSSKSDDESSDDSGDGKDGKGDSKKDEDAKDEKKDKSKEKKKTEGGKEKKPHGEKALQTILDCADKGEKAFDALCKLDPKVSGQQSLGFKNMVCGWKSDIAAKLKEVRGQMHNLLGTPQDEKSNFDEGKFEETLKKNREEARKVLDTCYTDLKDLQTLSWEIGSPGITAGLSFVSSSLQLWGIVEKDERTIEQIKKEQKEHKKTRTAG